MVFPQTEIGPDPAAIGRYAEAAESAGFSYLLAYDHVLGADASARPEWQGAYTSEHQFHEPLVLFGWLAARTRLELVTGVLVLPQRQTALVAKQAAEVDVLTGGRFRLGVGIGWNDVEYEALSEDFHNRGRRLEEQVEVMRLLWTDDVVEFDGEFHHISRAGILPRPIQRPIPVWMGARRRRALRRIGRIADGWIANLRVDQGLEERWAIVREAANGAGRSVALQGIVDFAAGVDEMRRQLDALRALGASHCSVNTMASGLDPAAHADTVADLGPKLAA